MASLKEQIDDLLGKLNPGAVVGLDIGAHSIKICELSGGVGKFKVERFSLFPLSEAALIEDEIQKPSEIIQAILNVLKESGIKSKVVCLGLNGPNTMTKRLNVPEGTKDEIEDHIMWEAEQYITFGAEDAQISFHIIGDNEGGGKDAFVAAAKKDVIDSYNGVLKDAKLSAKYVDLSVIAVSNVFEEVVAADIEEYNQGTLIIDFGAQTTKIIVYKRGGPIFTKEIPVGGGLITEEIQRQMGVSYDEAESLKTSSELPQEVLNIINVQVDAHVSEVRKNINFYVTQGSAEKVNYCFITGGSSLLPGLLEKLAESSGLDVQRLDVFSAFKINESKFDDIDQLSAIMTTVLGLAMRKVS